MIDVNLEKSNTPNSKGESNEHPTHAQMFFFFYYYYFISLVSVMLNNTKFYRG